MSSLSRKFTGAKSLSKANEFISERKALGEVWQIGLNCLRLTIAVRRRKLEK